MNSDSLDSLASPRKVATPPSSTPSMSSSSVSPRRSMVMVQAINLIPLSWAEAMSSVRLGTLLAFMRALIVSRPPPNKLNCDMFKASAPFGIIAENIFSTGFLPCLWKSGRRRALSPQKVKNIDTSSPMARAPLAMMKEASTLSKSPEKPPSTSF